jgi:hypothetical protein
MNLKSIFFIICFGIFFTPSYSFSILNIPRSLNATDRATALSILGYGSASKILDDPFPLGGYSGLELGFQTDLIQTERISGLGSGAVSQTQTSYTTLSLGKGLFNNVDLFAQLSLLGQRESVSSYGTQFRWGFFQASYFPIYMSTNLHWSTSNFSNLIATNSYGLDLIVGFKADDVTLYFGGGPIHSDGTFSGGTGGITDTGETVKSSLQDVRFIAGLNVKFGNGFFAGEIDNYQTAVYSAKIGYRY